MRGATVTTRELWEAAPVTVYFGPLQHLAPLVAREECQHTSALGVAATVFWATPHTTAGPGAAMSEEEYSEEGEYSEEDDEGLVTCGCINTGS